MQQNIKSSLKWAKRNWWRNEIEFIFLCHWSEQCMAEWMQRACPRFILRKIHTGTKRLSSVFMTKIAARNFKARRNDLAASFRLWIKQQFRLDALPFFIFASTSSLRFVCNKSMLGRNWLSAGTFWWWRRQRKRRASSTHRGSDYDCCCVAAAAAMSFYLGVLCVCVGADSSGCKSSDAHLA